MAGFNILSALVGGLEPAATAAASNFRPDAAAAPQQGAGFSDPIASLFGVGGGTPDVAVDAAAPARNDTYVEQSGKHKGVPGVARDVLGTLGDIFLTRLGVGPMYANAQQQRKMHAALEGFEDDPEAAIKRVSSINVDAGEKLRDRYVAQQIAQQKAELDAQKAQREQQEAALSQMSNLSAGVVRDLTPEQAKQNWPYFRSMLSRIAERGGVTDFEIPEKFDPNFMTSLTSLTYKVKDREGHANTREIADRNRESRESEGKANRANTASIAAANRANTASIAAANRANAAKIAAANRANSTLNSMSRALIGTSRKGGSSDPFAKYYDGSAEDGQAAPAAATSTAASSGLGWEPGGDANPEGLGNLPAGSFYGEGRNKDLVWVEGSGWYKKEDLKNFING